MAVFKPVIPNNIVVHIGKPGDNGKNITVPFIDYIKNVASNEIYPSWPVDSLKANILAIISFTLNRIYNEWYRSKGYDFDITSSSAYDQTYRENGQYFDSISKVVDEIFNNYIVRDGQVQPLYAQYCDGKNLKCDGLSQWGSVTLANNNYSPLSILKYYYGDDIKIIYNAQVSDDISTYPGFDLKLGGVGNGVEELKIQLNRISSNYPAIPIIDNQNRFFTIELENAVKKFQEIFNLNVTGVVDKATWYKIKYIYNAVKKISNLYSEGKTIDDVTFSTPFIIKEGITGNIARSINYIITVIAYFDNDIPLLEVGNTYDTNTTEMIKAFQKKYGLEITGNVDSKVWKQLLSAYEQTINTIPAEYLQYIDEFYPGEFLSKGMKNDNVKRLQQFLYQICINFKSIPGVRVNGEFDNLTESSVKEIQKKFKEEQNGIVGPVTWYTIVEYAKGNLKP